MMHYLLPLFDCYLRMRCTYLEVSLDLKVKSIPATLAILHGSIIYDMTNLFFNVGVCDKGAISYDQ